MTDTDTPHRPFLAPGSPGRVDLPTGGGFWQAPPPVSPAVSALTHTTARPDPITAALDARQAYMAEREALRNEEPSPTLARRAAALDLLVGDAEATATAALAEHRPEWLADLQDLESEALDTIADTNETVAENHPTMIAGHRTCTWLFRTVGEFVNWVPMPTAELPGEDAATLAAWFLSGHHTPPTDRHLSAVSPVKPHAVIADHLRRATLDAAYRQHRDHVDRYEKLTRERDVVEAGRADAEAADVRLLADAIARGEDDPGTPAVDDIDATIAEVDRLRAKLLPEVQASYRKVTDLVAEHRTAWLAALVTEGADASRRWQEASTTGTSARRELQQIRSTIDWLRSLDLPTDDIGGDAA